MEGVKKIPNLPTLLNFIARKWWLAKQWYFHYTWCTWSSIQVSNYTYKNTWHQNAMWQVKMKGKFEGPFKMKRKYFTNDNYNPVSNQCNLKIRYVKMIGTYVETNVSCFEWRSWNKYHFRANTQKHPSSLRVLHWLVQITTSIIFPLLPLF
jgi:hypothetical protein